MSLDSTSFGYSVATFAINPNALGFASCSYFAMPEKKPRLLSFGGVSESLFLGFSYYAMKLKADGYGAIFGLFVLTGG